MASVRDPGRAQMEAEELERARLAAAQDPRQARARRSRENALRGDQAARQDLAKDYAAVSEKERARALRG